MAIIHCPACNQRMSSVAKTCPACSSPIGKLSEEDRERLQARRRKTRIYRARNVTYVAMTLIVLGMLVWWFQPPSGLALPVPFMPALLFGLGTVAYVVGWCWLLMIRFGRS